jgi:NADPH:quinone reductase-like Zn-dependent oxidoreductase
MRAWRFHAYGPIENLRLETVPVPEPREAELLVKVGAAGANPIDWHMVQGDLQRNLAIELPRIPGRDCAGTVVTSRSPDFAVGDRVLAVAERHRDGTHAEYVVVPAKEAAVVPASITDVEATALGSSAVTAWVTLVECAQVAAGNRVLIHGGAGAVGSTAVQLARHFGAYVLATCSGANVDYVESLGAYRAIDYTREVFVREAGPCDIVFDTLGGEVHRRSFQVLKPGGLLVRISAAPVDPTPPRADVRSLQPEIRGGTARFESLLDLAVRGAIRPQVGSVFPFERLPDAYRASQSGHSRGKKVIVIGARSLEK